MTLWAVSALSAPAHPPAPVGLHCNDLLVYLFASPPPSNCELLEPRVAWPGTQ